MTFRALITLAEGIDDLQSVTLIDVLRRAGIEVVAASIEGRRMLTCARGTRLTADGMLVDVLAQTFDLIVLPGGAVGAQHARRRAQGDGVVGYQGHNGCERCGMLRNY